MRTVSGFRLISREKLFEGNSNELRIVSCLMIVSTEAVNGWKVMIVSFRILIFGLTLLIINGGDSTSFRVVSLTII